MHAMVPPYEKTSSYAVVLHYTVVNICKACFRSIDASINSFKVYTILRYDCNVSLSFTQLIGKMAVVNFIHEDGDPEVRYVTNHVYKFNIEAVSKVTKCWKHNYYVRSRDFTSIFLQVEGLTIFFVGDIVTVMDDIVLVHELQKDGPGWVDDMALVNAYNILLSR